jgi:hypothetical protein
MSAKTVWSADDVSRRTQEIIADDEEEMGGTAESESVGGRNADCSGD